MEDQGGENHTGADCHRPEKPRILAGRFELVALIGIGGLGEVYFARNNLVGTQHAVKLLRPEYVNNDRQRLRLQNEARAASRLQHPNIVCINAFGTEDGQPFIIMEYLAGRNLGEIIRSIHAPRGESGSAAPLSPRETLSIFVQISEALAYAHEQGVVHRDLKPSNIMVLPGWQVKLVDFGLAKLLEDHDQGVTHGSQTQSGDQPGSPYYMSPEQCLRQDLDARSDIYSLGCVMYEVLTGRPPFEGESALEILSQHVHTEAPSFSQVKPGVYTTGLEAVVRRCLEKDKAMRYQNASEVTEALNRLDADAVSIQKGRASPAAILFCVSAILVLALLATTFHFSNARRHRLQTNADPIAGNDSNEYKMRPQDFHLPWRAAIRKSTELAENRLDPKASHRALSFLQQWHAANSSISGQGKERIEERLSILYGLAGRLDQALNYMDRVVESHVRSNGRANDRYFYLVLTQIRWLADLKQHDRALRKLKELEHHYDAHKVSQEHVVDAWQATAGSLFALQDKNAGAYCEDKAKLIQRFLDESPVLPTTLDGRLAPLEEYRKTFAAKLRAILSLGQLASARSGQVETEERLLLMLIELERKEGSRWWPQQAYSLPAAYVTLSECLTRSGKPQQRDHWLRRAARDAETMYTSNPYVKTDANFKAELVRVAVKSNLYLAMNLARSPDPKQAGAYLSRALDAAGRVDADEQLANQLIDGAVCLAEIDAYELSSRCAAFCRARADHLPDAVRVEISDKLYRMAAQRCDRCPWPDSAQLELLEEIAGSARAILPSACQLRRQQLTLLMTKLALERGGVASAARLLSQASKSLENNRDSDGVSRETRLLEGWLLLARGNWQEAARVASAIEDGLRSSPDEKSKQRERARALALKSAAFKAGGREDEARALRQELDLLISKSPKGFLGAFEGLIEPESKR